MLACDAQGRTACHVAAAAGQDTALYLLAAAGANLEAGAGRAVGTPLMAAAAAGHTAALRALLILGANPAATDSHGACALHKAAEGGHAACLQTLLRTGQVDVHGSGGAALALAAERGHAACVEALLAAGARPLPPPPAVPKTPSPAQPVTPPNGVAARPRAATARAEASPELPPPQLAARVVPCTPAKAASAAGSRSMQHTQPRMAADPRPAAQPEAAEAPNVVAEAFELWAAVLQACLGAAWRGLVRLCAPLLALLLRWLAPRCAPALAHLGRCWAWLQLGRRAIWDALASLGARRRAFEDALAEALCNHLQLEFRPRSERDYRRLVRVYHDNPQAFLEAVHRPARTAAWVLSYALPVALPPLLLCILYLLV